MNVLLIAIGGFFGAIGRFVISVLSKKYIKSFIPIGTLLVNASGSFLLGVLLGKGIQGHIYSFFGVGFMGAFTTFSTFKLELVQLWKSKQKFMFLLYLTLSYLLGTVLAAVGYFLI